MQFTPSNRLQAVVASVLFCGGVGSASACTGGGNPPPAPPPHIGGGGALSNATSGSDVAAAGVGGGSSAAASGSSGTGGAAGPQTTAQSLSEQQAAHGWGPTKCPAPPAGVSVGMTTGDQLPEIVVKDCEGNDVSLNELCGADALWMFMAHQWCEHCQMASSEAEAIEQSFAGKNVASINVVVENASGGTPTTADCTAWREQFGHQKVLTFFDPTGATVGLWDNNFTALSVFVDRQRIGWKKLHVDSKAVLESSIQDTLDR